MAKEQPSRNIGSAEYTPEKAAARAAERATEKEGESQDKRSDFEKFRDRPHMESAKTPNQDEFNRAKEQKDADKAWSDFAKQDATRKAFAQAIPGFKAEPVIPAPENKLVPPKEIKVWPLGEVGSPKGGGEQAAADDDPVTNPYEMEWLESTNDPFEDEWDIEDGPTTNGTDPVPNAASYDGVSWKGARFSATSAGGLQYFSSSGESDDVTPGYYVRSLEFWTRELTWSSTGKLVHIGPEFKQEANLLDFLTLTE